MKDRFHINLFNMVMSTASAVDLVSPLIAGHHLRVAYIAVALGERLGFSQERLQDLVLACTLHDIGAFSLKQRFDTLEFEMSDPHTHAELGYRFLSRFDFLKQAAGVVRYHHNNWAGGKGAPFAGEVDEASYLIHLADRVDVLIARDRHVLTQVSSIVSRIAEGAGTRFVPAHVEALRELASKEYFWLDATSASVDAILRKRFAGTMLALDAAELESLARMFANIIDFKSPFTSTHSSGVAATAEAVSRLLGFTEDDAKLMRIAGLFHDIGKLAVPAEILEKPAPLDESEFSVMRSHTYHTRRVLDSIGELGPIPEWAASHHEKLDSTGYPFHHGADDLSVGARALAVADVFTALAEDRPYRKAMSRSGVVEVLQEFVGKRHLDGDIVQLLVANYAEVDRARQAAQECAREEYRRFVHTE
jgi:putative nucleotidyltransferase with HDIG domain